MATLERQAKRQVWIASFDIPVALQPVLGRRRFKASTKTRDRSRAREVAAGLEAQWRAEIRRADEELHGLGGDVAKWRRVYLTAPAAERDGVAERIRDEAADLVMVRAIARGIHTLDHPELGELEHAAQQFVQKATSAAVATSEKVEQFLATQRLQPKTIDLKRRNIRALAKKFPFTGDVTQRSVQGWVEERLAAGVSPKTLVRDLSDVRGYWRYLKTLQLVPENTAPFADLTFTRRAGPGDEKRRPFDPADLPKLHAAALARDDRQLADLITLGQWTGARIEELCSLQTQSVADDFTWFDIVGAKTEAGNRRVPVHPTLKPVIRRLVEGSTDGFVLSGLTLNKYGDRSNAIGKRFGRLKRDIGFDSTHVFHSIRKTVATLFENAGVPENVAADILGHEKPTMTYGHYSGGASLATKAEAVAKLVYPL